MSKLKDLNEVNKNKAHNSSIGHLVQEVLPELITRNTKLCTRLKSKLKVCSFLNNVELRNQRYLKELVSSSEESLQNVKSGLQLSKSMKLSSKYLSSLNSKIMNDCFMKKSDLINNTKKDLNKNNTEEETNMIIKQSLNKLKSHLNPTYTIIEILTEDDNSNKKNFFSENELKHAKDYINDKISMEEKILKNRISGYLDKVKIIKTTNVKDNLIHDYKIQKKNREINRDFYKYVKNVVLNDNNIKMINYKKLKPLPIKDKSCPNLQSIKHKLFPHIREGKIKSDNYVNINNCNSIKIINGLKLYKKLGFESKSNTQDNNNIKNNSNCTFNDSEINSIDKKNSFNALKRLINRNRSLLDGSNRKYEKLSTLIDIQLPKISEYESIIQKKHNQIKENLKEIKNNKDDIEIKKSQSGIKKIKDKEEAIISNCSNYELLNQLRDLKDQLQSLKGKKLDVDENYLRNKKEFINYLFNIKENPYLNNNKFLGNKERNIIKKIFNENPATRLPSSHSVTLLKRRFTINSGIKNKIKKINRNYSNHTRDRTCPSTLKNSIKNSPSSVFDTSKSEKEYKKIFNKINAEQKKVTKNRIIISPLIPISQDKTLVFSKNNYNSSNITSFSDF